VSDDAAETRTRDDRVILAAAVAGGYALGRTRRARLAFAVGTYLAGRRLGVAPGHAPVSGSRRTGQLQDIVEQVRGELLTAGRAAVTAVVDRRLARAAEALRHRTDTLVRADEAGRRRAGSPDEEYGEPADRHGPGRTAGR